MSIVEHRTPALAGAAAELLNVFALHGEARSADGDRAFLLTGEGAYLVDAGHVDVFSVRVEDGRAAGRRTHLLRVPAGHALMDLSLSVEEGGRGFLAVGIAGTRLVRVRQSMLIDFAGQPDRLAAVGDLLEQWIDAVSAAIAHDVAPARCAELEECFETILPAETAARPRSAIAWITHLEGRSSLLGRPELAIDGDGYTPVSRRAWIDVQQASRIRVVPTEAFDNPEVLWDGLARLHALVVLYVEITTRESERVERERMEQRAAFQRSVLSRACARLAETVKAQNATRRPAALVPSDTDDPLFASCCMVGAAMGVPMKSPPRQHGALPPRDPLTAILRTSRVRSRRVALRADWWRHDHGPLLGSLAEGEQPVALLPSPKGYMLHDPTRHFPERVTVKNAETIAPFAVTFYRPFPDGPLPIREVLRFGLQGCRRDFFVLAIASGAVALLGMIPPLATGMLFNTIIPGAQRSEVLQLTIVVLAAAFAASLFSLAQNLAMLRIEGRMGAAIQSAVWDRLLGLPLAFFRPYTAGDLAVRAMSIDAIRQIVSGVTVTAVVGGVCSLGNIVLMFHYNVAMAWRASIIILAVISVTLIGGCLQLRAQRGAVKLQARVSGLVLQLLSSIGKIRVAGVEPSAFALWVERFSEQRRLQFRVRAVANWVSAFNAAAPVTANVLIFWMAAPLLTHDRSLRTGDFLAFLWAFSSCMGALLSTCVALLATGTALPLYQHARPILDTRPEVHVGKADPGVLTGDIEIQHAVFRYRPDSPLILRDVSLRVKPGEFAAFVGPSGSGKSTLLRLLLGFETPESGAVYYDGQDLEGLDVQMVRRQIGVVLQSGRLMSGDIFTNIAGSSTATLDDAWEAARMAGLSDDIEAMPMGMHTVISEAGGTLSGGQRQRLLIARATVHRPRILLFDEATSALDNRTQAIVSASLDRLQATRIVVAHRLSTIINADRIYVLERGKIVQTGTYQELVSQPGLFADLARRQIV
jgi:ATP-binding cassette subfamily C protein